MEKYYKPKVEYFEWIFLIVFSLIFLFFSNFDLMQIIILALVVGILIIDILSRSTIFVLNERELTITKNFYVFSRISHIDLKKVKKLTLRSPAKIRGIRIDFQDGSFKTFRSNLKKVDLIQLGNDFKLMTSVGVFIERYFSTEKLN